MSSISFGQSSPTGTSHEFRRPFAGFPSYDHFPRHRSPSPGPSARRNTYDSYKPRGAAPYYDDHPNSYRPNVYRPERYYSRSPSPPRYDRARTQEARQWDHGSRWQSSSSYDKRLSTSPPPWDKNRRDTLAERMFEPSELWKQSQFDRPTRYEPLDPTPDRYGDRRQQPPRDLPPPRSAARSDSTSHYDSYRPTPAPHAVRDLGSFSRTADTYRPMYLDDPWPSTHAGSSYTAGTSVHPKPHYDREDEHQGSSIASTPPRSHAPLNQSLSKLQHPPHPPFSQVETYRTSPRQYPGTDSGHRSFSPSISRSRGSSISREAPVTKVESRSLSRSPRLSRAAISEPDEDPLLQSSIQPVQAKAHPHALNEMPLANNDEAPLEGSKSLGTLVGPSAELHSPRHETVNVNGNFASHQQTFERNTSPLPTPELISSSNATPHRESPHEVVTPHVDADSMTVGSVRGMPEEASPKVGRAVVPEPSVSSDPASFRTSIPDVEVEPDRRRESPPLSTVTPSFATWSLGPGPEAVPSSGRAGLGVDLGGDVNKSTPEPVANSMRIVVSDHSTIPASPPSDRSIHYQPESGNLKSTREGVRLVLVARLGGDRQSRAERVFPILRANQVVSSLNLPPLPVNQSSRSEELIAAGSSNRLATHEAIRSSLVDRFVERQSEIVEKSRRLKEEYLALHERWLEHCARLDEGQKTGVQEESAIPSGGGRATRRSTAVMGDAVRSDLEMEQIIASLGVEDLTDPNYLAIRNVAKIPDMISVTEGSVPFLFDDTNNIVDDPSEFYSATSGQDYWTEEERDIFLNEFAAHPKQFGLIAQRLPNKTAAQCITYYYLHKKQGVDFRKAVMQYGTSRRRKNGRANKQRGNALLTDIRRHDDEVSRISPGTPNDTPSSTGKRKRAVERTNGESRRSSMSRRATAQPEATSSGTTPDPDVDQPRRKRRAARAVTVVLADDMVNDDAMDCPVPA